MKFHKTLRAFVLCILASVAVAESADILKISVLADGQVLADGHVVELDELKPMFAELANNNGTVLYYRENASQDEPHPNTMAVIQLIIESRLPISFSTEPDFSTVVDGDGNVKKRQVE